MAAGLSDLGPLPRGIYDEATLWWRHENLHREILRDYPKRIQKIISERNAIETKFLAETRERKDLSAEDRLTFTGQCFDQADRAESEWLDQIKDLSIEHHRPLLDKMAWRKFDRKAERAV
jgi:hypothetical protein